MLKTSFTPSPFNALLAVLTACFCAGGAFAETPAPTAHTIVWTGSMPAKTHTGLLTPKTVESVISADGQLQKLKIVIDMDSIDVTDLDKGKMRDKLMAHLRSKDFFNVSKSPTASFELDKFAEGMLSGRLTIRDVEKEVKIPATLTQGKNNTWELKASFEFNRKDFNVMYQNKGLFGTAKDKLIKDEINIDASFVLTKA